MRVVLLAEELGIGGLPNYVLTLARGLTEEGVAIIVAHGNAPLPPHLEVAEINFLHLPGLMAGADDTAATLAMDALRAWQPDIVHVHLCSNVAVIDRLLDSGLPLVRSFHDYTSLCLRRGRRRWSGDRCQRALGWGCAGWGCIVSPPRPGSRIPQLADLRAKITERDRYRGFSASIVSSAHMARTLFSNGFAESRTHVVPHFSRFEADATSLVPPRKRDGKPGRDRPLELLFSGQAVTGKGLEVLVAALSGLAGDWRLTVLAEGPRLAPARAAAAAAGLSSRIDFMGWTSQSAMREHYRTADLLVIPSVWDDPVPLVGLEAMSFGTPLIGFAVGGIPDYLLHEETGLLVRETTAAGLLAALTVAIGDPQRLSSWGYAARKLVATEHTKATHLAAMGRIYLAASCHVDKKTYLRIPTRAELS
jgi:glycosyltransferase involved in cell wall biosynthesis